MLEKRSEWMNFMSLGNCVFASGLMSAAVTDLAFEERAVFAWMPDPEPMSKMVLFFARIETCSAKR